MQRIRVLTKRGRVELPLPSGWRLLGETEEERERKPHPFNELLIKALEHPIDHPPLEDVLAPSMTVAILIDDLTRPTPRREILEVLLRRLEGIGIPKGNILFIVALGTHRPLSGEELKTLVGDEVLGAYRVLNHDPFSHKMVPIGRLRTGGEVKINPLVYEADFRIALGSLLPHPLSGFGGGGKALMPGVCDFDSIKEHHLHWALHRDSQPGRLKGNPFYEEIRRVAEMGRLDFIINCLYDFRERPAGVIAGGTQKAHTEGSRRARELSSFIFSQRSEVTITTSFPYDEGSQIFKPLVPASFVTKSGGVICLVADCKDEIPEELVGAFETFILRHGRGRLAEAVRDRFLEGRLILEGAALDMNMALGVTLSLLSSFRMILISEDIPREKVKRMGLEYAPSLKGALDALHREIKEASLNVIAAGGTTLPVLRSS